MIAKGGASSTVAPTRIKPPVRATLLFQLVATLVVLAWMPGNFLKLFAFAAIWIATFGRFSPGEAALYVVTCCLFSAMDLGALRQGVFSFAKPDFAGLPVWEFFMWGYYVLHVLRFLGGEVPSGNRWLPIGLAAAFGIPFSTISDPMLLLMSTVLILAVALWCFHERLDFAYMGYMILVGAAVEYVGVWSGQWSYPGGPPGGVPFWFITMWGGVGLFARRLMLPVLRRLTPEAS